MGMYGTIYAAAGYNIRHVTLTRGDLHVSLIPRPEGQCQSVSLALTHLVGQQDEPDGGGEYVGNKQIDVDCIAKTAQIPGKKQEE